VPIDDVAARGFQAGAAAYELARPGYPDAALAALVEALAIGPGRRVCDLAAGTGKLTRRLVEAGADVVAVEPVEAMRAQLAAAVGAAEVEVVDGTAEAIPLPDASVDVVTVAQAFHWFDAPEALAEIARVLRPGGGLALLWNERDESTAWVAEMSRLIRWHERTVSRYQHVDWAEVVAADGRFAPLEEVVVRWDQPMTREVLADRVRSISYIAVMPSTERERLAAEVTTLVGRLPEPFPLPYTCRVQWAHLR
jgi:ubiquinone/menaquinone biosynthesis C-methylase UbiE